MNKMLSDFDFDTGRFIGVTPKTTRFNTSGRRLPSYVFFIILVIVLLVISGAAASLDELLPHLFA